MADALVAPVRTEVMRRSTSVQWAVISSSSIASPTSGAMSGPGSRPSNKWSRLADRFGILGANRKPIP